MTEPREALARLRRVETRPAGRGMVIVHEIDESHPANNSCDICALVTLRSEGPGLDAPSADLCGAVMATYRNEPNHSGDHWHPSMSPAQAGVVPRATDLSKQDGPEPGATLRSEGPGLDAHGPHCADGWCDGALLRTAAQENPAPVRSTPSLDEGLLGKAVVAHRMKFWASEPCVENCGPDIAAEYSRLAQEGETP